MPFLPHGVFVSCVVLAMRKETNTPGDGHLGQSDSYQEAGLESKSATSELRMRKRRGSLAKGSGFTVQ